MIDSHCHLTYPPLAQQLDAVLKRAAEVGVTRLITIGTSLADTRLAVALCQDHPQVRCTVGIHPHHAAEAADADVAALGELAKDKTVLGVGEIGLDYHYDFSPRPRQREVFIAQLELAKRLGCPMVVHCREAIDDCMAILRDFPNIPAVFHCFTGLANEARRILDAGYLLGFTGVITFKRSEDLRDVIKFVPMDRLLIETDAPYLAPEPLRRQKVNESSLLTHIALAVCRIKGLGLGDVDQITTENTIKFFRWE